MKKKSGANNQNPKVKSKSANIKDRYCQNCGKAPVSSNNRPNSLHKTKRRVKPNLQKFNGKLVCTRCLRKLVSM